MKQLKNIKELEGELIKKATVVKDGEGIVLTLTSDKYVFINIDNYGNYAEIRLDSEPSTIIKKEGGVITKEEYEKVLSIYSRELEARIKEDELKQLELLKAKYE